MDEPTVQTAVANMGADAVSGTSSLHSPHKQLSIPQKALPVPQMPSRLEQSPHSSVHVRIVCWSRKPHLPSVVYFSIPAAVLALLSRPLIEKGMLVRRVGATDEKLDYILTSVDAVVRAGLNIAEILVEIRVQQEEEVEGHFIKLRPLNAGIVVDLLICPVPRATID